MSTNNITLLAMQGFRYAKRLRNGNYDGTPGKRGATHRITAHRPNPRIIARTRTAIRCAYADKTNFIEFTGDNRATQALDWLHTRRELARAAVPYSACTHPLAQIRAKLRARWAEQDTDSKATTAKNIMGTKPKPKPAPAKRAKADGETRNGLIRPAEGTITGKVWAICDKLDGDRIAVLKECARRGISEGTAKTQQGRWRVYHHGKKSTKPVKANPVKGKPAPAKARPKPAAKRKPASKPKPAAKVAPVVEMPATSG